MRVVCTGMKRATDPKHPDFEAVCGQYQDMLWMFAHKAARVFKVGEAGDYVGQLVVRLNEVLHWYDPSRCKFTTYYYNSRPISYLWRAVLAKDFERWKYSYYRHHGGERAIEFDSLRDGFTEQKVYDFHLYRTPDVDETWCDQIIGMYESTDRLWQSLTEGVTAAQRRRLLKYYKDGLTLDQISGDEGVSKQAVHADMKAAMKKIRAKLEKIEAVRSVFHDRETIDD